MELSKVPTPSVSPENVGQIAAAPPPKQSKGLACIFCQQRKVKCDRQNPCNTCTKARVQCSYRARRTPRRKEARATEVSLRARLGRLEDLLKTAVARNELLENDSGDHDSQDVSPDNEDKGQDLITAKFDQSMSLGEWLGSGDADQPEPQTAPTKDFFQGRMFTEKGKSRYIENKLWSKIYDEVKDVQEILDEESSDESEDEEPMADHRYDSVMDDLVFGVSEGKGNVNALHPSPANMSVLWVAFTENVNPLNKIVHVPSTQPIVKNAMMNPDTVSKADTAFLFAVWLGAVTSLDDQNCQSLLGEPRPVLLKKYKIATQKALINAGYLKSSNLNCLRAFVLYLLAIRPYFDSKTFWSMVGLAVRVSQRLGIHKDGALFNLPPFETEMRRRLWWQIIHLDVRASEVAGAGIMTVTIGDIKRPLNVNDEDLWPDMPNAPVEHEGPTEMCFVLLRCSIGRYFRYLFRPVNPAAGPDLQYEYIHAKKSMDETLKDFELFIQNNFLTNVDPLIPIQFFTASVGRAVLCSWRVMDALRRMAESPNNMSSTDRDLLFEESIKGIEYDNLGHTTKATQRFMWHIASHFQWHSLISLLHELRTRATGDLVERAWTQVGATYQNRPELMKVKNPLHAAIARLTLAAWRVRDDHYTRVKKAPIPLPEYISTIRQRLSAQEGRSQSINSTLPPGDIGSMSGFENMFFSYRSDPISTPSSSTTTTTNQPLPNLNSDFNFSFQQTTTFRPPITTTNLNFPTDTTGFNTILPEEADWFNTPLSPTSQQQQQQAAFDDLGTMDWNMWGSLLQNYELPMDGKEDFIIPPVTTTSAGTGTNNYVWK